MGLTALFLLERPQEIDDFLLLLSAQLVKTFDNPICLTARAPVISDGLYQVGRPSIMQEKDALADAQRGAVRNSSGPAPPCMMPSPSAFPIWCTIRSE